MKQNIIILLLLLTLVGCKEDVDEFEPYVETAIAFPEVVDLKPIYKQFNAEEDSRIDLGGGEVLRFPANSLENRNGQTLTGKIDLSITQIRKKADLIYAYMNSNIGRLDMGQINNYHVIHIKAYQNTQEVFMRSGKSFTLKSPTNQSVAGGHLWQGLAYTPNDFGWEKGESSVSASSWEVGGSGYSGVSYDADRLGWLSGAQAFGGTGYSLCVSLTEGLDAGKTKVYFVFDDAFSVAELKILSDTQIFCGTIPSGSKGHLIVINEEEPGVYRYQNESLTITEDKEFSAQPRITVLENIILSLNAL
ncbi:MAG TPA: hypothetical protein ENK85_07465 [Saprospiraceae bacterium]|nr:hypothetical protein [Saprospiraceae bacterium]